jgi:Zn-dependent M28 family amino/carboxypeptidase
MPASRNRPKAAAIRQKMHRTARPFTALAALAILSACVSAAQQSPQAARFDGQRALEHTRNVVAFGPRPAGSPALARTRDYIRKELTALGLTVKEQAFEADTPAGKIRMVNVRAMIGGPDTARRLIVAGHYDTKLFKDVKFVGANDGGSSTGFLIELARALKQSPPSMPVELLFLDGEEAVRLEWLDPDNRYGSRYYVESAKKDGTIQQIAALVLVDMIGDSGLGMKRESQSTPWLTSIIWETAARLGRKEFLADETPIEDDHIPFLEAGVPAVDLIDLDYQPWHTPQDTMDKLSAKSFQSVGDVLLAALPAIEKRVSGGAR